MRGSPNRQTISSTARWNYGQSAPGISPGAQKAPLKNQQTGQGTNLAQLQLALAKAQEHLKQVSDPRLVQNISHGIDLLKAQIARANGIDDYMQQDLNSVRDSSTGFEFAGLVDGSDFESAAIVKSPYDQSLISPYAAYQLAGTLRQKITNVAPPSNATPGGSLKWQAPQDRSNVIRTPNNPGGSTFEVGTPGIPTGHAVADHRNTDYSGNWYRQDDPSTHINVLLAKGTGGDRSRTGRGKQGQYYGGYQWSQDVPQSA
jgi:hypothetical protein